jgi:hypothetical protein
MYLQHHPNGTFAAPSRQRLSELALKRAKTVAELLLILDRYSGTKAAQQAARRLPRLRAKAAMQSTEPDRSRQFLQGYPGAAEASQVRSHLAGLLYPKLASRQLELERFLQEFSGTRYAAKAKSRLETLLAEEVRQSRSVGLLKQFRARFPSSKHLEELDRAVLESRIDRAVASLDVKELGIATGEHGAASKGREAASRLALWCKKRPRRCELLRKLAGKAMPWRPDAPLAALRQQAYAPDMQVAWRGIVLLGRLPQREAGDLLLEMVGSGRLSTVWIAEKALDTWLSLRGPADRRRWLTSHLRRSYRGANSDEVQRYGHLRLLAGEREAGTKLLRQLLTSQDRMLTAGYLVLRWSRRLDPKGVPSSSDLTRLTSAVNSRVKWLKSAFPAEVHQDSLVAALLAERELFAIQRALASISPRAGTASALNDVKREVNSTLLTWRSSLAKASDSFEPAQEIDIQPTVSRHDQGRAEALARLRRTAGGMGLEVASAICRIEPHEACRR